jgi:hypothetical protein
MIGKFLEMFSTSIMDIKPANVTQDPANFVVNRLVLYNYDRPLGG